MQTLNSLLESSSGLSRFKARNGLNITHTNNGSSYILMSRIKKILKRDITKESYKTLKLNFFSKKTEVTREVFIDRMITKIDGFSDVMLNYVLAVYESDGIDQLVITIRQPLVKIRKAADKMFAERVAEEDTDDVEVLPDMREFNFLGDD